jgi:hypothetical protein
MKDNLLIIRNTAFCMMVLCSLMVFGVPVNTVDVMCMIVGAFGLVVAIPTFWLDESRIQKAFFIMAGGGAAAMLIAWGAFHVLALCGHKPGGDGGGMTLSVVLLGGAASLIGSIGAIVCLVRSLK